MCVNFPTAFVCVVVGGNGVHANLDCVHGAQSVLCIVKSDMKPCTRLLSRAAACQDDLQHGQQAKTKDALEVCYLSAPTAAGRDALLPGGYRLDLALW